ncbi:hypothetical protein VKT23_009182 [Stygiomarasmius scandens]|uniref:Uncharacterized protein n=1 Tax=Marasmiellus scandens TaxID=2682957 RepID=A0ABR1JFH6_9AGAR
MAPIPQNILPDSDPKFQLNSSGLAGFFGGDEAISAMNTTQFYQGRNLMGFYNSPGGFRMAKHYGRLAKSPLWRGFFPEGYLEPHEVFNLDGGPGKLSPDFWGSHNGAVLEKIGHLGFLFFKKMRDRPANFITINSRRPPTRLSKLTIVKLNSITLPPKNPKLNVPSTYIPIFQLHILLCNAIPMLFSVGAAVVSVLSEKPDWYAFSLILLGMIAHGAACLVLGSGKIRVDFVTPPRDLATGGLMMMDGRMVVVLGREQEMFQLTRASIAVDFPDWVKRGDYWIVGFSCLLLMVQLLVQLFIIPQATLFGQILFLSSFLVSWLYNTYIAAIDKEDLQRQALGKKIWNVDKKEVQGYVFENHTTLVIAMLYILQPAKGVAEQFLDRHIPIHTPDWKAFKRAVVEEYENGHFLRDPPDPCNYEGIVRNMYLDWHDAVGFYKKFRPRGDMSEKLVNDVEDASVTRRYPSSSLSHENRPTSMMMDETWVQI